jgi:hypothetical protein
MKLDLITNKAEKQGEVNPNDEFYTPNYAIEPLLKHLKSNSKIWCPFDTNESNFVKLLKKEGHNVSNSHISEGLDFFDADKEKCKSFDYIISNPPYSIKAEVFQKLFELERPFAMLVGVVGLFESKKRFEMFRDNKIEVMYFDKRISYFKSYDDQKPSLNPPFSSVFLCSNVLENVIVFENVLKK